RYHLNGPVYMMTARKRVGPLPTHRLAVKHSTNHSSSDSSSEASSDFYSDASSDSTSRHPLSDHYSLDLPSTFAGPSRKRRRSPMTSVPALSPVSGALSPVRADLIPSPKRVRDSGLRDDAIVRVSDEPHLEQDSDLEIQAEIDECFAYADALKIFVMPYLLALIESHKSSTQNSTINEFIIINIPEEDVEPEPNLPLQEIIILNPDYQPITHLNMIRENNFDGYLRADSHDHIREFLAICDMFKYGETQSEAVKLLIFPHSLFDKAKTWFNELNEESITS
ncbi:hypothetical protein Tco_1204974, partial [Tanacetum coccineum]